MAAAIMLGAALSGCVSIVEVRTTGQPPKLSVWPGGVKIERGRADAIAVNQIGVGVSANCGSLALGLSLSRCVVIDPKNCGVAIIEAPPASDKSPLSRIAAEAQATCLHQKGTQP